MPTEKQRMLSGELYFAYDPELVAERLRARRLLHSYNATGPEATAERRALLLQLFGALGERFEIEPPFFCDYGANILLGERVLFNCNCVVLDVAPVTIGDHTLFGPAVQVYTVTHPLDAGLRRTREFAKPIDIGRDVWVGGGGAILCPGVRIGARSVIGAGSVVTRDIPADMFAAGNPCRVIRPVSEGDGLR